MRLRLLQGDAIQFMSIRPRQSDEDKAMFLLSSKLMARAVSGKRGPGMGWEIIIRPMSES